MLDSAEDRFQNDKPAQLAIFSNLFVCALGLYCLLTKNMDKIDIKIFSNMSESESLERFDVIFLLIDPKTKCEDSIKTIKRFRSKVRPETKIVVMSFFDNVSFLKDINKLDLSGYINVYLDPNTIISTSKDIIFHDKKVISTLSDEVTKTILKITPRQLEILNLISKGYTNKEIAKRLGISPFTVRMHISSLIRTLNVPNRYAAVSLAKEFNLI